MHLSLRQLSHLVAVAHLGSFSRAAKELNLSQPALSRSVSTVEKRFGVRIFERSRSAVIPTAVGRELIDESERLINQARALEQNLVLWGQGKGGSVSFGAGPAVASIALPKVLARLAQDDPDIHVTVQTSGVFELLEMLERRDIEFLFASRSQIASDVQLSSIPVGSLSSSLFVRLGHPLTALSSVSISDVLTYPIARGVVSKFAQLHDFGCFRTAQRLIVCDDYTILNDVMLNSNAVLIAADPFLAVEIKNERAVALACVDFQGANWDIDMIWLAGRDLSPSARKVGNLIAAVLNG